jgi:hypothetical protein
LICHRQHIPLRKADRYNKPCKRQTVDGQAPAQHDTSTRAQTLQVLCLRYQARLSRPRPLCCQVNVCYPYLPGPTSSRSTWYSPGSSGSGRVLTSLSNWSFKLSLANRGWQLSLVGTHMCQPRPKPGTLATASSTSPLSALKPRLSTTPSAVSLTTVRPSTSSPAYINRVHTPNPDGHFLKEAQDDIEPWSVSQISYICVDGSPVRTSLAWGCALTELTYTWSCFFEHLKTALQCNNLKQTFVLDRQMQHLKRCSFSTTLPLCARVCARTSLKRLGQARE